MSINIIFDGPPSHEAGRFIEIENDDGHSICIGEWSQRPDGYWQLKIDLALTEGKKQSKQPLKLEDHSDADL